MASRRLPISRAWRRGLLPGACALAALLAGTAPALAQGKPPMSELAVNDRIVRTMMVCVINREPQRARLYLETVPGTADEDRVRSSFQSRLEYCMPPTRPATFMITPRLMRGAMAEELYRRFFPTGPKSGAPAPELLQGWVKRPVDTRADVGRQLLAEVGRCVVARDPKLAAALLASEPFASSETTAINALTPAVSACLDAGAGVNFTRQSLRAIVAEALYDYAVAADANFAPRPTQTAGKQ